jgi:hypothetical protein
MISAPSAALVVSTSTRPPFGPIHWGHGLIIDKNKKITAGPIQRSEPHEPTKSLANAACQSMREKRIEHLLGKRTLLKRSEAGLPQTEHPNALRATWRLSSVNGESAHDLFHSRCARAKLE